MSRPALLSSTLLLAALTSLACDTSIDEDRDARVRDTGSRDAGTPSDLGPRDATQVDASASDANPDAAIPMDAAVDEDAAVGDGGPLVTVVTNPPGPRQGHSATLLQDGRVLVVGGRGEDTETESWLFDPVTTAFTAGPAISARNAHRAIALADGRVLIAGGRAGVGANAVSLNTSILFDPSSNTFSDAGNFQFLTAGGQLFTVDSGPDAGRVLVIGYAADFSTFEIEVFDPTTATFTHHAGSSTTAVYGATMTKLSDGRILLAGGYTTAGNADHIDTSRIYDPTTRAFSAVASLLSEPKGEMLPMLLDDGTTIFFSGRNEIVTGSPVTEIFDPTTDTFSTGPTWNEVSFLPSLVKLANGTVLLMNGNLDGAVHVYDPVGMSFSEHPQRMSMRLSLFSATLLNDGRILAVGGQGNNGFIVGEAEIFVP